MPSDSDAAVGMERLDTEDVPVHLRAAVVAASTSKPKAKPKAATKPKPKAKGKKSAKKSVTPPSSSDTSDSSATSSSSSRSSTSESDAGNASGSGDEDALAKSSSCNGSAPPPAAAKVDSTGDTSGVTTPPSSSSNASSDEDAAPPSASSSSDGLGGSSDSDAPARTTQQVQRKSSAKAMPRDRKPTSAAADEDDLAPRDTTAKKRDRSADGPSPDKKPSKGLRTHSASVSAAASEHDDDQKRTLLNEIVGRLCCIQSALAQESTPPLTIHSLITCVPTLQRDDIDDATKIAAVEGCFNATLLDDAFRGHPQRPELIRALFDFKKALNPVNRAFTAVYETLLDDVAREDRLTAQPLSALMTLICGTVDQKAVRAQVDACRKKTEDEETCKHLKAVVDTLGQRNPLDALAERIEADLNRATNLRRRYAALFQDMPESRRRAVLSFFDQGLAAFEKRQVRVLYHASLFPDHKITSDLSILQGESGSGKTCSGLFHLTTPDQLVVFVHTPPVLVPEKWFSAKRMQDIENVLTEPVRKCIREAQEKEKLRDEEQDEDKKVTAHSEVRRFYKEALQHHILDTLKARIGTGGRGNDGVVEVVFFFDELGSQSTNSEVVRPAVRDLALEDASSAFRCKLETQFGLNLAGVAMAGTGLDIEVAVGSLNSNEHGSERFRTITAKTEGLQWSHFAGSAVNEKEVVPAPVEAELEAVLRLPRLAALVLDAAGHCGELSKGLLSQCVPAAAARFARINALKTLVDNDSNRQEVGLQCLRLMLYPHEVKLIDELDADTRAFIARYGVAALAKEAGGLKVVVGPAQRLLVRHFFALTQHSHTGEGFELTVADFLCLAAVVSRGKTLGQFVAALNEFCSHRVQYDSGNRYAAPTVKAPEDLAGHVLCCTIATVKELHWKVEEREEVAQDDSTALSTTQAVTDKPNGEKESGGKRKQPQRFIVPKKNEATVLVNAGQASWDLQLVLPVKKGEHGTTTFVTFNIQTKRFTAASFSHQEFQDEKVKAEKAPAVVKGAVAGGFIAVVGRLLCEADWIKAKGAPVWHVNLTKPGSLGVTPFRVWSHPDPSTGAVNFTRRLIVCTDPDMSLDDDRRGPRQ